MRVLIVGPVFPWPVMTGIQMRLARTVEALSRLGEVDLFAFAPTFSISPREGPDRGSEIAPRHVSRSAVFPRPKPVNRALRRLWWLFLGRNPIEMYGVDYGPARRAFLEWVDAHYDLIWFFRAESHAVFGPLVAGPTIVDLDDIESVKLRGRIGILREEEAHGLLRRVSARYRQFQARVNASRWESLQQSVADSVDAVVFCSEVDKERFDLANSWIIPNAYERPKAPVGKWSVRNPPTILLQGSFVYGPNRDAAAYLVERVRPELERTFTDLRIRLVGTADTRTFRFHNPPAVTVTNFVPAISDELAKADLVAIPIRYGSGTRIKILEAFAHRIPVVATPKAAEGLDVVSGQHLLLADTPATFADGCRSLLSDIELRNRVVENAERLFLTRYEARQVQDGIRTVAWGAIRARKGHEAGSRNLPEQPARDGRDGAHDSEGAATTSRWADRGGEVSQP